MFYTPDPLLTQYPLLLTGFNNSLSVAHWRPLAPPPDTGRSVWASYAQTETGPHGVEGGGA